jgi:hypothetical protein
VKGGPFVHAHDIVYSPGTKSIVADLEIQTFTNDCKQSNSPGDLPNVLLSHSYTVSSTTGRDALSDRTVRGNLVFRRDRLEALAAAPDDFRQWFIMPAPPNFQRVSTSVDPGEDGCSVSYSVTDRERITNIIASNWPN